MKAAIVFKTISTVSLVFIFFKNSINPPNTLNQIPLSTKMYIFSIKGLQEIVKDFLALSLQNYKIMIT